MTGGEEAGTHPWFEGGTTLQHARRTESTHMTRADAHRYAQLPPGSTGLAGVCSHAQPGCPISVGRHKLNTARQFSTY